MQSESAYARPLPFPRSDPMVYPKGNPRYGSIETAGCSGRQKQKKKEIVHTVDMPLHANHNRNAMGKRAAVFGHEIGGLGISSSYNCSWKRNNALALLPALRATCECRECLCFRSICSFLSLSVSLPTRVGLMLAAALRSGGKDNNSNNTKMNHQ